MGGYAVTLYGTKRPHQVDGIITSGALTRYNNQLFGELDRSFPVDMYVLNELGNGVCSDEDVISKYALDDLVAKEISLGLIFTLMDGVEYLKNNSKLFSEKVLILHGKDDGIVSVEDSVQFYSEIKSTHKSLRIYDGLQHEILNESSYNENIYIEIVNWLGNDPKNVK
ncbi:lysophospholipase [Staphylococcus saccharolyticus]|mgnify:FL=1|uniref:Lysophospholipase n=1 Tax=Staphylococcus saccharolyticus TaxID=33028 RepID=A0A380GY05_9STAP|nr:lysophospholipase [Staphylococcus saccharolyticus]